MSFTDSIRENKKNQLNNNDNNNAEMIIDEDKNK